MVSYEWHDSYVYSRGILVVRRERGEGWGGGGGGAETRRRNERPRIIESLSSCVVHSSRATEATGGRVFEHKCGCDDAQLLLLLLLLPLQSPKVQKLLLISSELGTLLAHRWRQSTH